MAPGEKQVLMLVLNSDGQQCPVLVDATGHLLYLAGQPVKQVGVLFCGVDSTGEVHPIAMAS